MQNAQDILFQTIEGLLEENEIDKAIDALLQLDQQTQAGIRQDVILQSGNYKEAAKMFRNQMISFDVYQQQMARTRFGLLDLMKEVPQRVSLNAKIKGLDTYQFDIGSEVKFEKMIGPVNNLLKINWLERALNASKAVCKVNCSDGSSGTGFLTKDGYIFTNNHVLPTKAEAQAATIDFNYEMDTSGKLRPKSRYKLDASTYVTSDKMQLDFAYVKVIDDPKNPLKQWGFVEFETSAAPGVGEPATIIQHPEGEDKQIALNSNDVISVWGQYLFYLTDTQPGSSGSPVFNKDWKVVAIHHAGVLEKDGGMQINAAGEKRGCNRGIFFKDIFAFLKTNKAPVPVSGDQGGKESFNADPLPTPVPDPMPTPVQPVAPVQPTQPVAPIQPVVSTNAIPKFVVIYDIADAAGCDNINKHLTVLKMTKKIEVYNVHKVDTGDFVEAARQQLLTADYVLVLLSANIFNNDGLWLGITLESLEAQKRIIPVKLGPVNVDGTGLEKLRSLPSLNRTVADFTNAEAAWADITEEIKRLVKR